MVWLPDGEKLRDASCLYNNFEHSLLLLVTLALDLAMRTIKFCSVVFGVTSMQAFFCHKQNSLMCSEAAFVDS